MTNPQSDNKTTKQIRIDSELHYQLKQIAASRKMSIKLLAEEALTEIVGLIPKELINYE